MYTMHEIQAMNQQERDAAIKKSQVQAAKFITTIVVFKVGTLMLTRHLAKRFWA